MSKNETLAQIRWRWDWYKGNLKPGPPYFINIEPTNICNLKCTICSMGRTRKPGYMGIDLYNEVVQKAAHFKIKEARLFLAGEPLLHKQLPEMIESAKKQNLITTIHTNATGLTEEIGQRLIQAGLDILSVSFHGENEREYESVMRGANYREVLANVKKFLALKKNAIHDHGFPSGRATSVKPKVIIQVVKSSPEKRLTLEKDFKEQFKGLPVDRFLVLPPHNWAGTIELDKNISQRKIYYHCQHLYQSISIAYNGDVFACCGDLNGKMIIDNIKDKTIREIWHSQKFQELRRKLKNGEYKEFPLCSSCDVLWRNRHPFTTDLASLLKLPALKNKLLNALQRANFR